VFALAATVALVVGLASCGRAPASDGSSASAATDANALGPARDAADAGGASVLVHLADRLDAAQVTCGTPPANRQPRVWDFAEPRPEWTAYGEGQREGLAAVSLERQAGALHVVVAPAGAPQGMLRGGVVADVEGGRVDEWSALKVRARSHDRFSGIAVAYNVDDQRALGGGFQFMMGGEGTSPIFNDGSVQEYLLPLKARDEGETLRSVGLIAGSPGPGAAGLELLSLALIPRGADFDRDRDARPVTRGGVTRTALYAHTPARLAWTLEVPPGGRLDVGLSCLPGESLRYRVTVGAGGSEPAVLLDEPVTDGQHWTQRSVDLSKWAGGTVELALAAESDSPGSVALWGAPIVSGAPAARDERPNVILYVIDGGGADFMSVYGYNRRTTPFLERLAEEAVVFERAHSNSTWTQPSTASFMTGLQHSVLGGLRRGLHSTPVPAAATTMAEHLRRGGWSTGVFTTNPNAARVIGLQRGVDVMHDLGGHGNHSGSSPGLHARFAEFRAAYPGRPFWAHFQTTDVHEPSEPVPPFAGLFVSPDERKRLAEWDEQLFTAGGELFGTTSIAGFYDAAIERGGIDRQAFFNARRGLYDETMAFQDRQLERFVQDLKERGEWERTLLIITADHGHPAGTFARFGRGLLDPQPEPWQGALCDTYATRVPLIVVWPGHIAGGRRIEQPVGLVDLLPTVLELAGLPASELTQGVSLAPLLLAPTPQRSAELAAALPPVVLDEFRVDEATGEMIGNLELIDGRWGASLEIGPVPPGADPGRGRHAVPAGGRWGAVHPFFPDVPRLLLYDLRNDPIATRAVNDEHPELVEKYRARLLAIWDEQRALAARFHEAGGGAPMSPEEVQQLEALGYTGR